MHIRFVVEIGSYTRILCFPLLVITMKNCVWEVVMTTWANFSQWNTNRYEMHQFKFKSRSVTFYNALIKQRCCMFCNRNYLGSSLWIYQYEELFVRYLRIFTQLLLICVIWGWSLCKRAHDQLSTHCPGLSSTWHRSICSSLIGWTG